MDKNRRWNYQDLILRRPIKRVSDDDRRLAKLASKLADCQPQSTPYRDNLLRNQPSQLCINRLAKYARLIKHIESENRARLFHQQARFSYLAESAQDLANAMDCALAVIEAPKCNSAKYILSELRYCVDDLGARIDARKKEIIVETDDIALSYGDDTVELGPMEIVINWKDDELILSIRAVEPNYAYDSRYFHPHANESGNVCLGTLEETLPQWLQVGQLSAVFESVEILLETYNPDSPYHKIEEWYKPPINCEWCSARLDSDDYSILGDSPICDDCHFVCESCCEVRHVDNCHNWSTGYCDDCGRDCYECDTACDRNDMRSCDDCGQLFCDDCISYCDDCEREECAECRAKYNNDCETCCESASV